MGNRLWKMWLQKTRLVVWKSKRKVSLGPFPGNFMFFDQYDTDYENYGTHRDPEERQNNVHFKAWFPCDCRSALFIVNQSGYNAPKPVKM